MTKIITDKKPTKTEAVKVTNYLRPGIKRAAGLISQLWTLYDLLAKKKLNRAEMLIEATKAGFMSSTASTTYGQWRKGTSYEAPKSEAAKKATSKATKKKATKKATRKSGGGVKVDAADKRTSLQRSSDKVKALNAAKKKKKKAAAKKA